MKSQTQQEKVIYIWSIPANGHLNPTLCFTNQLLIKLDEMEINKIVFYCGTAFRDQILNLPNNINNKIEFRDYELEKYAGSKDFLKLIMNFDTKPGSLFRAFKCWENAIKLGNKHIFKRLIDDMNRDKPSLILYDQALFFPKLTFKLYSKKFKCQPPLHACYVTTFLCAAGVYPNYSEMKTMGLMGSKGLMGNARIKNLFITGYDMIKYVNTYYKTLLWDNSFNISDLIYKCDLPFERNLMIDDTMNLVFVLPEIQPRLDEFQQSNIKFVGSSIDESCRKKMMTGRKNKYDDIIDNFLNKNLKQDYVNNNNNNASILMRSNSTGENFKKSHKPIIYVSMGTVFNNENSNLFKTIVDACKSFSNNYAVIVSTGDEKTYEKYSNCSTNNILFVPHTPQIEILKRTSLFITHAGMNSVSEAIHYSVPVICLPLSGDQPMVALRVEELGIGIRLQADQSLTMNKVKAAINKIFDNSSYHQNVNELSLKSKMNNGHVLATDYLIEFFNKNRQENNSILV